jgi:hypothetical protein
MNTPINQPKKRNWWIWGIAISLGVTMCCTLGMIITVAVFQDELAALVPIATTTATVVATPAPSPQPMDSPTGLPTDPTQSTALIQATQTPTAADVTPSPTSPPQTATPQPTRTVDDVLADAVPDSLSPTDYNQPRLVSVSTLFGATPDEVGHKLVTIRANTSINDDLTVAGMLMDAVDYYDAIRANSQVMELDSITLLFMLPVIDAYGNESEIGVCRIQLTPATLERINWDVFQNGGHRRLPTVAESYFVHSMLRTP